MIKQAQQDKINPYEIDKLSKIPSWLIILLLKFWAASAAVYFSLIGGISIGLDFSQWSEPSSVIEKLNQDEKIIIVLAVALALALNYIVKPIIRLMNNGNNDTYKFNMINGRGIIYLFVTFLYTFILSIILYFITLVLSYYGLVLDLFSTTGSVGIDPLTYGFCFILVDGIFVLLKDLIKRIISKIKYSKLKEDSNGI